MRNLRIGEMRDDMGLWKGVSPLVLNASSVEIVPIINAR